MQQILDTMRALQVEVAASRVDNAKLRRANEELRRDLQYVGECATNERAPPTPPRAKAPVRVNRRSESTGRNIWRPVGPVKTRSHSQLR